MTTAYQKRRNKDRRHAALMKRDPALREALYGPRVDPAAQIETLGGDSLAPDRRASTRETAQEDGDHGEQ